MSYAGKCPEEVQGESKKGKVEHSVRVL